MRLGVSSSSVGTCRSWWVGSVRPAPGDLSNLRGVQVSCLACWALLPGEASLAFCLLAPWAGSNLTQPAWKWGRGEGLEEDTGHLG